MAITHRNICIASARWLLDRPWVDVISWEFGYRKCVYDSIAVSKQGTQARVGVIECKRTRADLLADLRKQKLLKYEHLATHCWLAVHHECFLYDTWQETFRNADKVLTELKTKGLPSNWGVLLLKRSGHSFVSLSPVRGKGRISRRVCDNLVHKIAKSYMYRALSNRSPLQIK